MKKILLLLSVFVYIPFANCEEHDLEKTYLQGIESAKKEILSHLNAKIRENFITLEQLHRDDQDLWAHQTGKLNTFYELKLHLKEEFENYKWQHPTDYIFGK